MSDWNDVREEGAATASDDADWNGAVLKLTFQVADGIRNETLLVSCGVVANTKDGSLSLSVISGSITVQDAAPGDLNVDGAVTADDAVYLLYHTLFGAERYPVDQPADYTGDGRMSADDAIYLLYYTLFGAERYPLAVS